MRLRQYYLECLSHASYLIGDETSGLAVIVDPRRDTEEYLADAAADGLRIVGVINTHFHADFVAGHLELAAHTGAWIGYGRRAAADFDFRQLSHGDHIPLGEVDLEVLETPGHTWESISVVVRERADDLPKAVLTGDSLFIGDVGRPDLVAAPGSNEHDLARALFQSVHGVLLKLPDETLVMPAHGAGSSCGKNLSTERVSTIGEQRATNPSTQPMSEQEFVAMVSTGQPTAPEYFARAVEMNRSSHPLLAVDTPLRALTPAEVRTEIRSGAVVIDSRTPEAFAKGHIRGSYNVGIDGRFAETAGMVAVDTDPIVLVTDVGREEETRLRLGRIGFDGVVGYLDNPERSIGDLADLATAGDRVDVAAMQDARQSEAVILDVRNEAEIALGAVPESVRIPLAQLKRRHAELPMDRHIIVHCASGWRSSVAASILRAAGHSSVCDVRGGYAAWAEQYAADV